MAPTIRSTSTLDQPLRGNVPFPVSIPPVPPQNFYAPPIPNTMQNFASRPDMSGTFVFPADGRVIRKLPQPPSSASTSSTASSSPMSASSTNSRPLPITPPPTSPPPAVSVASPRPPTPPRGRSSFPKTSEPRLPLQMISFHGSASLDLPGPPSLVPSETSRSRTPIISSPGSTSLDLPSSPYSAPRRMTSPVQKPPQLPPAIPLLPLQSQESSHKRSLSRKLSKRRQNGATAAQSRPSSPPPPVMSSPKLRRPTSLDSIAFVSSEQLPPRPRTRQRIHSNAPPRPSNLLAPSAPLDIDEQRWSKLIFVEQPDGNRYRVSIRGNADFGKVMKALRAL
ncbi:hypothetical protein DL96DRAFT_1589894 [Flagelloscypha sp. PMI_526]|nr:hypothetical protein DL96DRAFT_1589894 [Flagelloscypha sp. PMI_526]